MMKRTVELDLVAVDKLLSERVNVFFGFRLFADEDYGPRRSSSRAAPWGAAETRASNARPGGRTPSPNSGRSGPEPADKERLKAR